MINLSLAIMTLWGGDMDDRRSTTGNVFSLAGGAVSWLSKKQTVVALSTSEAEYVALSVAAQEAMWFHKLLDDLQITSNPILINEDNQGAIALIQSLTPEPSTSIPIFILYEKHRYR